MAWVALGAGTPLARRSSCVQRAPGVELRQGARLLRRASQSQRHGGDASPGIAAEAAGLRKLCVGHLAGRAPRWSQRRNTSVGSSGLSQRALGGSVEGGSSGFVSEPKQEGSREERQVDQEGAFIRGTMRGQLPQAFLCSSGV